MMHKTVTAFVTKRCNFKCRYCIAGCNARGADIATQPDYQAIIDWCVKFAPGCDLHVTGGEPLLRKGIGQFIRDAIDAGLRVSLFTNGGLLPYHHDLYDLPIAFHITHHFDSGVTYSDFFEHIRDVPKNKCVYARVYAGRDALGRKRECEKRYIADGIDIKWISDGGTYHNFEGASSESPVSNLALIGQDGHVHPCSRPNRGVVGDIYAMTFDGFADRICYAGKRPAQCNAFLSAQLLGRVHDNFRTV